MGLVVVLSSVKNRGAFRLDPAKRFVQLIGPPASPYRPALPATARIFPGDARQIANADSALAPIAIAKAMM